MLPVVAVSAGLLVARRVGPSKNSAVFVSTSTVSGLSMVTWNESCGATMTLLEVDDDHVVDPFVALALNVTPPTVPATPLAVQVPSAMPAKRRRPGPKPRRSRPR